MKLVIEIECNNAAFEDDYYGELLRIFKDLVSRIPGRADDCQLSIHDTNGNYVGKCELIA